MVLSVANTQTELVVDVDMAALIGVAHNQVECVVNVLHEVKLNIVLYYPETASAVIAIALLLEFMPVIWL